MSILKFGEHARGDNLIDHFFCRNKSVFIEFLKKKDSQVPKRHTKFWSSIAHWNLLINPEFKGVNLDSFQVIQTLKRVWSVIAISAQWLKQNRFMLDISIVLTYKHHFKNTIGPYCDFGAKRNAKQSYTIFLEMKIFYNINTDCCSIFIIVNQQILFIFLSHFVCSKPVLYCVFIMTRRVNYLKQTAWQLM